MRNMAKCKRSVLAC